MITKGYFKGFFMDIQEKIGQELGIRKEQAAAAIKLIDEGCTIPLSRVTEKKPPAH